MPYANVSSPYRAVASGSLPVATVTLPEISPDGDLPVTKPQKFVRWTFSVTQQN